MTLIKLKAKKNQAVPIESFKLLNRSGFVFPEFIFPVDKENVDLVNV